jgi:hypothetical protein
MCPKILNYLRLTFYWKKYSRHIFFVKLYQMVPEIKMYFVQLLIHEKRFIYLDAAAPRIIMLLYSYSLTFLT